MKRTKIKYICIAVISIMCIVSLTACYSLDYTEEEEDVIANYAANLLLRHDENYKYKFVSEEVTTKATTEESNPIEEETESITDDDNASGGVDLPGNVNVSGDRVISDTEHITEAMNVPAGITVEYLDYDVVDRYPSDNSEDGLFVMKSVDNHKLLVVKFRITNTTGQDIAVNMMSPDAKYKGIVNDTKKYNAQLTLLLDALNTYEGTINAGSSQDMVLIYQTQIEAKDEINSLSVAVSNSSDSETVINLK